MGYTKEDVEKVVTKMQDYQSRFYKLTPADLADFLKIKSNFIQAAGITLSTDVLSRPKDDVIKYLLDHLNLTKKSEQSINTDIIKCDTELKETLEANVDLINQDRTEIRKQIFNENVVLDLERAGRVFSINWNSKMTVCKISIPSSWQIKAPQSLLLDINEKDKKVFESLGTHTTAAHPGLSKLG